MLTIGSNITLNSYSLLLASYFKNMAYILTILMIICLKLVSYQVVYRRPRSLSRAALRTPTLLKKPCKRPPFRLISVAPVPLITKYRFRYEIYLSSAVLAVEKRKRPP